MKHVRYLSLWIIIIGILLSGCSKNKVEVPKPEIVHDITKPSGKTIIRVPALNSTETVEIGENMYQKISEYKHDTYDVIIIRPKGMTDDKWRDSDFAKEIKKDSLSRYLHFWGSKNLNTVCRKDYSTCWVDANNTNQFTHEIERHGKLDALGSDDIVDYKLIPTPSTYTEESFRYTALYQGRIGNKVKISFREFKNDIARPAFTQDIDYELNKSGYTIIGFKGLRIKIIKATNLNITYSVIQDYN